MDESTESVLAVFAHPDDESLAAGGFLARAASRGARTGAVSATWTSQTERGTELQHALDRLGVGAPRFLGYADAKVPESARGAVRLLDAPLDEAVGRLVSHIREFKPGVVLTHDWHGGLTGHPDHVHTHQITTLAVEAAGLVDRFPGVGDPWMPRAVFLATHPHSALPMVRELFGSRRAMNSIPDDQVSEIVDVSPWIERKVAAILEHRSEVERGAAPGIIAALTPAARARLLATEWYVVRPTEL